MANPSFYNEPQVQYLERLLVDIKEGFMQVPRFQRPFVWTDEQRVELFNSIKEGIPIGSIMVWRTTRTEIQCYQALGPHHLDMPQAHSTRQYLLDGVQRLSTLFGALHSPNFKTDGSENYNNFIVYYDLEKCDFVIGDDIKPLESYLPLTYLLNSSALVKFQRNLTGKNAEAWIEESDRLTQAFRNYKIPIIPIVTEDLALATRTFQRINSQGTTMQEAHMVHALSWSPNFDLRGTLEDLKNTYLAPIHWETLDDDLILRVCKAAFNLDLYETKPEDFSNKLSQEPKQLELSIQAIANCAQFLDKECHIPIPELVPYASQIIILSDAFRQYPSPSADFIEGMKAWFWLTTLSEMFGRLTGFQHKKIFNEFRAMMSFDKFQWQHSIVIDYLPLKKKFITNSARAKTVAILLLGRYANYGKSTEVKSLVRAQKASCLLQLYSSHTISGEYSSNPGNRFLLDADKLRFFFVEIYNKNINVKLKQIHLISEKALEYLNKNDARNFITTRHQDMADAEEQIFKECLATLHMDEKEDYLRLSRS